jgi:hypothetical protein
MQVAQRPPGISEPLPNARRAHLNGRQDTRDFRATHSGLTRRLLASNQRQGIEWKASLPFFFLQESHALFLLGFENMVEVGVKGGADRMRPLALVVTNSCCAQNDSRRGTDTFTSNEVSEDATVYKLGDYR